VIGFSYHCPRGSFAKDKGVAHLKSEITYRVTSYFPRPQATSRARRAYFPAPWRASGASSRAGG